ncbi:hypothetical protein EVAR_42890_1 [Eumeta japonica]|uniref:Uncharacterized protein n=1 Tax=Eumeta variegata TaxID=151549 RepID=A0A4C1YD49_EUMVA|nr:hypothetical protein EVAR_42890_1 [Eumeta japonica]
MLNPERSRSQLPRSEKLRSTITKIDQIYLTATSLMHDIQRMPTVPVSWNSRKHARDHSLVVHDDFDETPVIVFVLVRGLDVVFLKEASSTRLGFELWLPCEVYVLLIFAPISRLP